MLKGQVALVTGANSGIGRAIVLALAKAGADVVINYVEESAMADEIAQIAERMGRRALTYRADVTDAAAVNALFQATIQRFGRLDIVICNAGIQRDAPLLEMSYDDWSRTIQVNLTGPFLCIRAAAKIFVEAGAGSATLSSGKIVCIGSLHQDFPWQGHANYAVSKAGLKMLVRTAAKELARHRIRVNSVVPGAVRTAINRSAWDSPEAYAELCGLIPFGRIAEPDDIASAVTWLCTEQANYITGASIVADGGLSFTFEDEMFGHAT